ncbi:MAG: homoserine kinase [Sphingomonadales bacterium]
MAVYTDVDRETLQGFLRRNYDLGELIDFAGIPEGIQNTNYYVKTEKGKFILTLFERRTPTRDLPFFFDFMKHLDGKGFSCPLPVATKAGYPLTELVKKPAVLVTFLPGLSIEKPSPTQCFASGELIGRLHRAGKKFQKTRENLFSPKRVETMFKKLQPGISGTWPGWEKEIEAELAFQAANPLKGLPFGTIHADVFPENVFFKGDAATGLIDFYFACRDFLAFDLAIALSCWGFNIQGTLLREHFKSMLEGYEKIRPLTKKERAALPILLRRASLSFLMTRVEDVLHPPGNILGMQKDPKEFMNILANQQKRGHIEDYF